MKRRIPGLPTCEQSVYNLVHVARIGLLHANLKVKLNLLLEALINKMKWKTRYVLHPRNMAPQTPASSYELLLYNSTNNFKMFIQVPLLRPFYVMSSRWQQLWTRMLNRTREQFPKCVFFTTNITTNSWQESNFQMHIDWPNAFQKTYSSVLLAPH